MRARRVLALISGLLLVFPLMSALAQPPQGITLPGGIGMIPTSMEEFEAMFPGVWGKVIALIVFVGAFTLVRRYFFEGRRRRDSGIVGWAVPFIAALLTMVIVGPPIVSMLNIQPQVTGPSTGCNIQGTVSLRVIDAVAGTSVTSGTVYLLSENLDLPVILDKHVKGELTDVPKRAVSSGSVTFDNVKSGTYLLAYIPTTLDLENYAPTAVPITVYCSYKPNSDQLAVSVSALELKLMKAASFLNEVETAVAGYNYKPASYPAELKGLTVWLKSSSTAGATPYFYIYVNYNDAEAAPTFKVGGTTIAPTKISDLQGSDPLRLNAPSGYAYVLRQKIEGLYGDKKIPIEISGTFQGNTTVTMKIIYLADSERGEIAGGTFTLTVNNKASSPGWVSP
ncbi:MAG: hypothetical protein QW576_03020 [Candidatus Korarchaeum sp.]